MTSSRDNFHQSITEEAAAWYVANRAAPLRARAARTFLVWLRRSPAHIDEYLNTADVARDLRAASQIDTSIEELVRDARADLASVVAEMPLATPRAALRRDRAQAVRSAWLAPAVAAALVAAILGTLWSQRFNWMGLETAVATAAQQVTQALPDGSTMTLDARSSATVRFSLGERHIEVLGGRVHFSVAHGSRRPFRVAAGFATAVAIGTEFDVDRRGATTIVTVTNGRVRVDSVGARSGDGLTVTMGERIRVGPGGISSPVSAVLAASAGAWRDGRVVFDQQSLAEVVEELNRYATEPIEIDDAQLREVRVSGVLDQSDGESFVGFLKSLGSVEVARSGGRLHVRRTASTDVAAGGPHH
jgi:transmembrane sensor